MIGPSALLVRQVLSNPRLWMGWRMALVGALPILLFLTTGRAHRAPTRIAAALGSIACVAGTIATHGAEDLSIEGRLKASQVAGRSFQERPILGVGEGAFLEPWSRYAPIDSNCLFGHRYAAHNLVLEVLGDLGLLGLFGLLGSGYAMSWFLFALCGFATCCDAWGTSRAKDAA